MASPNDISTRRLSIAKQIYLQGYFHALKNTAVDDITGILSFDQCAEILVKSALLDNNKKINGTFPELLQKLKDVFSSNNLISEISILHTTRNNVQHSGTIPAHDEVIRFRNSVKEFFSEVCVEIYENKIDFESISMAFLIKGLPVKFIIQEMEKAYSELNYVDCEYYAKKAVLTHIELLEQNIGFTGSDERNNFLRFEKPWFDIGYSFSNRNILDDVVSDIQESQNKINEKIEDYIEKLHDYLTNLESNFSSIIHHLILGELHSDAINLFGNNFIPIYNKYSSFESTKPTLSDFQIIRNPNATQQNSDNARTLAYKIIFSTQNKLSKYFSLGSLFIYDNYIVKDDSKKKLHLGCIFELSNTKYVLGIKDLAGNTVKTMELKHNNGIQVIQLSELKNEEFNAYVTFNRDNYDYSVKAFSINFSKEKSGE